MWKHLLRMATKKQHASTLCNVVVIKDPHTVKHLIIVNIGNNMGISLKLIEILFIQRLH